MEQAAITASIKTQQAEEAKEQADLEAALKISKDEATIHINKDSDDTIQKILKTPIEEDFLHSSALSSSSVHPQQTQALEDIHIQPDVEEAVDSPPRAPTPPPSSPKPSDEELFPMKDQPLSLRVVIPKDKDSIYPPCESESICKWSIPTVDLPIQNIEDVDCLIIGESSSNASKESSPPLCSPCCEEALAAYGPPPRPLSLLQRQSHPDAAAPKRTPSTFRPWKYPASWESRDDERLGEDYIVSEQIDYLNQMPVHALYKENFPGLGFRVIGYEGRKDPPQAEIPALTYESAAPARSPRPSQSLQVPVQGTIFHHGLKPRTRVLSGCSLWTNHVVLDRRFPFTIPLNKIEYISLGYMKRIVLPWNRRSETSYRREVPLNLTPSVSPDYED